MLKWRRPDVEVKCAQLIIENTEWPFKLNIYDNRHNTANTARIWNKLIKDSTCDYICIIDSDAFVPKVEPCWLTRMMETLQCPNGRLVVPLTDNCSTPEQKTQLCPYRTIERFTGIWSGFCFLFHKSLIARVGPFDEDFVGYGQDSEFAARMERKCGGAYIRKDVFVQHIHGASFKVKQEAADADREYARALFVEKTREA
jgi:GT2 family glycosyltransferase